MKDNFGIDTETFTDLLRIDYVLGKLNVLTSNAEITRLHSQMVRNIFLNTELLLNDDIRELSEYDIQGMMFLAFRYSLAGSGLRASREAAGRMDCVLYEGTKPRVVYEIKTYFKNTERLIERHFKNDIFKLYSRLVAMQGARGYFVVVAKQSKFKSKAIAPFELITNGLREGNRSWIWYDIGHNKKVRLRPSKKESYGRSAVLTWEVKI